MGYFQAGFDVVGIDIEPQPNYPADFYQHNCLKLRPEWIAENFDAVAASPPCQAHSVTNSLHDIEHPDLIEPTRELLEAAGLPYVMENVPGAPLIDPVTLCGSSFGLSVRRHRLFETNWDLAGLDCKHRWQELYQPFRLGISRKRAASRGTENNWVMTGVMPVFGGTQLNGGGDLYYASVAMGIHWMDKKELNQAIPPAYTMYIGRQLYKLLCNQ